MKKLLLIALSICLSLSASAQKIHFTDTTNVWKELEEYNSGGPTVYNYYTYNFIKDTTIDTTNYRWFSTYAGYCGEGIFVREDTVLNKVYIRECGLGILDTDVVLMAYNLNIGDTFTIVYYEPVYIYTYIVTGIDSTFINGLWYKVWNFSRNVDGFFYPWCSFIEGIGCIEHPLYMAMMAGVSGEYEDYMYCFSNNGVTSPLSPPVSFFDNDTSCATFPILNTSQLQLLNNKLSIYPDPATTSLNISATGMISKIGITNMVGQTVYDGSFSSSQAEVDVSHLPDGVYFVKVNGAQVRKFLKE